MNPEESIVDVINEKVVDIIEQKPPKGHGWFRVGDLITINNKVFRIKGVKPTEIRLKLVPRVTK
jgi:uncharacterized Zn finger protein